MFVPLAPVGALPRSWLALALLATAVHLALFVAVFPVDCAEDAFITFRVANNLAHGLGPVFNAGERVETYTNPLWMAMLAGLIKLGVKPEYAAPAPALACWIAALILLLRALPPRAKFAAALLALNADMTLNALSGMETQAFTLALAASAIFLLRGSFWACPTMAAAWLLRTDGFAYLGALAAAAWVYRVVRGGPWRAELRRTALAALGTAALYAPFFAWRWHYFGYPLPNTYYAKTQIPFLWNLDFGWRYAAAFLRRYFFLIGAGVLFAAGGKLPRGVRAATGVFAALNLGYIIYVGGDTGSIGVRFFLPLIVVASLLPAAIEKPRLRALALALVAAQGVYITAIAAVERRDFLAWSLPGGYEAVGKALRRSLPPGTLVAAGAIGKLGYYSELPIYDFHGLADARTAHSNRLGSRARPKGHIKVGFEFALDKNPGCLWLGQLSHRGEPLSLKVDFADEPLKRMLNDPRLQENYVPTAIPLANSAQDVVLLCRADLLPHIVTEPPRGAGERTPE